MPNIKFNGLIQEFLKNPNTNITEQLQNKLHLPHDKAETLAHRIKKKYLQATDTNNEQKQLHLFTEVTVESKQNKTIAAYNFESLSNKEFELFTKWFLQELGYSINPEKISAMLGVDYIAVKEGLTTAVLARKYSGVCVVSDAIVLLAQQAKAIYQCEHVIVLVTAVFSEQAKLDAEKCGVELWDVQKVYEKIVEIKKGEEITVRVVLPKYEGTLFDSLLSLEECKVFIIEKRAGEKYDLFLPGVAFPLLTFQAQKGLVTRLVYRVKYNESVGENDGEALIKYDRNCNRLGPDDMEAYTQVKEYLEQFLD